VQPVLATVSDTVGTLTHDVAGALAPVEAAVQPVLATVSDTLGTLTHDAAGVLAPLLASAESAHSSPATDLLHSAVSDTGQSAGPADALLAIATSTHVPIELPGPATAAPDNVATDASNAASAINPTAIAGDVIALIDASPPPANALFNGTQYTHYGVALSSDIGVPPSHAGSPVDIASAHDTAAPAIADTQKHSAPAPDIADATHPIDHLVHAIL
jgi:hypothetical protein